MFEHKGYVVGQTDQSIFINKNDRLVLHASTNGKMDEEELMDESSEPPFESQEFVYELDLEENYQEPAKRK